MTGLPIVTYSSTAQNELPPFLRKSKWPSCDNLHGLWIYRQLPQWVTHSPPAMRLLELLGPLPWHRFPERDLERNWGQTTIPYAALTAAALLQLNEKLVYMSDLRTYLIEHPALIYLFGFPLVPDPTQPHGFNPQASVPSQRHLTRMLRTMPNSAPKFLLAATVTAILAALAEAQCTEVAQITSLDTKHIIAWVKENNPKAYVSHRYDKTQQPPGDPDCKLGCKKRHNQRSSPDDVTTPTANPVPASTLGVGEYYWGYGTGVVATKVPTWGEFVIAELTLPFNRADVAYFFPLMAETECHLGFRPRICAFDAAFDAFYVHEYFYRDADPGAFAAVPFVQKGGYKADQRHFGPPPDRLPLCAAGLPMPLRFTYTDRTSTLIEHERGKYICPLQAEDPSQAAPCPVDHERWAKGGCTAMMPTSIGARLRYTLDRQSEAYKDAYRQRTATERINSQAVALGIERPKLRNGQAIANRNTLIYTLINLRLLQRIRARLAAPD